jgi:ABC-type branched-subunit amino acid transport system ATPase component
MSDILTVRNICQSFGGHKAVDDVSFEVEEGSITSLIGPNGAGKTTVFNLLCGILPSDSGDIVFEKRSIRGMKPHEVALAGIGRTFQDPRIFPWMSALDNVMVGMRQRGEKLWPALWRDRPMMSQVRQVRERAEQVLDMVGLSQRSMEPAASLSFGEQRFLSIARTLASKPRLILMDEPTVGLDQSALNRLTGLMSHIAADGQTTLLIIEHNMDVVMSISKKIVLLVAGRVEASDTPEKVRVHQNMLQAYLGRKHAA